MSRFFVFKGLLILMGLWLFSYSYADNGEKMPSTVDESQLKAVYLVHLSGYTSWPPEKMDAASFNICLDGQSELNEPLKEVENSNYLIKNKVLHVENDLDKLNNCHVFYVRANTLSLFRQLQNQLIAHSVLTVSSEANFNSQGGHVQYYPENNKIRMQVNLKALQSSKLTMSSQILQLMKIVDTP